MHGKLGGFFRNDESGAISSLYAIAILPLVVMAGVAFDYGRMMGLDTELQNAADQAALAAATQLDGSAGSRANAITAANNALGNQTRFANDGDGRTITVLGDPEAPDSEDDGYEFFQSYSGDQFGPAASGDGDARVVLVTVEDRGVRYALTPVMAAFNGGIARGRAAAKLLEATCNAPPMMFCQPKKPDGTVDSAFPTEDDVGKGLMLHFKSNGGSNPDCPPNSNSPACKKEGTESDETIWAPGNFGFLEIEFPGISESDKNRTLGLNSDFLKCFGEPPATLPGYRTPQGAALNSRLDFYPPPKNSCNATTGDFCPSTNTRKSVMVETNNNCNRPGGQGQGQGQGQGPTQEFVTPPSDVPDQGYPKDNCFKTGACNVVGNNNNDWNSSSWIPATHSGYSLADVPDYDGNGRVTRYEVYKWEMTNPATLLADKMFTSASTGKKYCSFPRPVNGTGIAPTSDQKDRRILTVAAVDCSRTADEPDRALSGHSKPYIVKWVDLFLVKTVEDTGSEREFFTEIKGPARLAGDRSAFQKLSRRKAVLIR
ncbi:TadE/TadG family type IV pilus assembly protein [Tsuneonella amylolytica]|uniref:TadE/TadG family type IV pilus assembly protein n=1 Tax=Tsuneonella amylolytica TaxID=2338327 RepID=UPI000EA8A40A|nr:Tad domain-containing protein [Tsuneonella amylolytica]